MPSWGEVAEWLEAQNRYYHKQGQDGVMLLEIASEKARLKEKSNEN